RRILETVRDRGYLTDVEYTRAFRQVAEIELQPRWRQPEEAIHLAVRFREIPVFPEERIRTAIDMTLQRAVTELARDCVAAWSASGARNAAAMVIDGQDETVISLVGSVDYFDRETCGAIDYTRVRRSPGSTLKPFVYALGFDTGVIDENMILADDMVTAGGFRNFDRGWMGPISVDRALASSRNVPAVHILRRTGVYRMFGCLADLDLHRHDAPCDRYGLGLAIGGMPVTMEQLARAYSVFSHRGLLTQFRLFNGQVTESPRRIFSESTVAAINSILSDPMARLPSFPRMGHMEYDYPVAVKTGTSEGCRDAWTVAWSPRYRVVTWMGRPDGRPMRQVTGYRATAELAHRIMDALYDPHKPALKFGYNDPSSQQQSDTGVSEPSDLNIISPESNTLYLFDPEIPSGHATIVLSALADSKTEWLTWEIDDTPFRTVSPDIPVFWPIQTGRHIIRVRSSQGQEDTVTIDVGNKPFESQCITNDFKKALSF
ncbi:hypothetical protein JXA80_02340, partial [bacterium]|nr:hypothetical protein [candidate division CSSED10-310 bacterium]